MKIVLFSNTDWYLFNYRLPLARALQEQGYDVTLLSPPGRYTTLMEQQGLRWRPFALERKGTNPLAELATIARLIQVFKHEKPDIIHNFTIKPVLYGSIAARLAGIPRVINSITGLGFAFSEGQSVLQAIVTWLYRISLGGTNVIFQNPDDRDVFTRSGLISAERAHLIPGSGVDMKVFCPSPEPDGEPVVVLAGRFLRSKGIPEFVEAAKRLRGEGIQARFALVGGPYPDNPESVSEQELSTWQKEVWVEYWGWHDDMAEIIPQAAIVCLPSNYKEGLPRILLEASACGRPTIATDIPGCRLAVRHGENGLLIPPRNVDALVQALRTLLADRSLRQNMGARGREIVQQEFSVETVIAHTLRVYAKEC